MKAVSNNASLWWQVKLCFKRIFGTLSQQDYVDIMMFSMICYARKIELQPGQSFYGTIIPRAHVTVPEIHFQIEACPVPGGCSQAMFSVPPEQLQ